MTDAKRCPVCGTPVPGDAPEGACPECLLRAGIGATPSPSRQPAMTVADAGRRFPQFEVLSVLGQGGMGVVYKARQRTLDRIVALKVLPADVAAAPGFADRFQREARALARLDHPHIVRVYESGMSDGLFYLAMEFVDGTNLRQAMAAKAVHPREALAIVPQICDALQYAHDQGVVHRDVKPENVLLDREGHVKVADFGLAKLMSAGGAAPDLTVTGQVMGTPHYMAPEQIEHPTDVDHRADIYSLGVVFYEMLTGELPLGRFAAPSRKVQIDVRLDEIVLRTLEKERESRYQRVAEVRTSVDAVVAGTAPPAAPAAQDAASPAWHPDETRRWRARFHAAGAWLRREIWGRPGLRVLVVTLALWGAAVAAGEFVEGGMETRLIARFSMLATAMSVALVWAVVSTIRSIRARTASGWDGNALAVAIAVAVIVLSALGFRLQSRLLSARSNDAANARWMASGLERQRTLAAEDAAAQELFRRLSAVHGLATYEKLRTFYGPDDRAFLDGLAEDVREKRGTAGALGLPLVSEERLGAPLSEFVLTQWGYGEPVPRYWITRRNAVARHDANRIELHFVRAGSDVFFAAEPLQIPPR